MIPGKLNKAAHLRVGYHFLTLTVVMILFCIEGEPAPEITVDLDACVHCNMNISKMNEACGFFAQREFLTFDSPGCLLREFEELRKNDSQLPRRIYFVDYDSRKFITADSTFFLITNHLPTVMNAEVICFSSQESAGKYLKFPDEKIVNWEEYRTLKGIPDKTVKIILSQDGMRPDVVILEKNELVEWIFIPHDLKSNFEFYLKGYDEIGKIRISAESEPTIVKMFARKPGAGFPFINLANEKPLGMVKVKGAHTKDEEMM